MTRNNKNRTITYEIVYVVENTGEVQERNKSTKVGGKVYLPASFWRKRLEGKMKRKM